LQTIGITGGTGFIGTHLSSSLLEKGYKIIIFTRSIKKSNNRHLVYAHWDAEKSQCDSEALSTLGAMVHLAGAGIADKRWTNDRKKEISDSRIIGTRFLISQLKLHAPACKTFISASATGYYGPDRENLFSFKEDAKPYDDFIAGVCKAWENEANQAPAFLRTVILRFGIVLGKDGGAFQKLAQPVNFGIVPILASGKAITSWIHIDDHCRLIIYALENAKMQGVFNAVSPYPVSNKELMTTIAEIKGGIKIPFHVPAFILKMMLGKMSSEVLKSCTVSADKTIGTGFIFQYAKIEEAIKNLIS
jgi:uncharacterized protein (TIGR01777 family)